MTETYYASVAGSISNQLNDHWSPIRDASAGTYVDVIGSINASIFMRATPENHWNIFYRGMIIFDATEYTGGVSSAKVRLYCNDSALTIAGTHKVRLVSFNPASKIGPVLDDYDQFGTAKVSDDEFTLPLTTSQWYEFSLNATGLALLTAGLVAFGLRIDNDADNSEPTPWVSGAYATALFNSQYAESDNPELVVNVEVLDVDTLPATNMSSTSATLNGELISGGNDITCSFEAGLTVACSDWAGGSQNVDTGNSFDAQFDAVAAGIPPGSTVYFKAKAVSGDVTAYGEVLSFTLANYPTVGTTRVSGLVHRWQPGRYVLEVNLGGLASGRGVPVPSGNYEKAIPTGTTQQPLQITRDMYESWLRNTDINVILQSFGHFPTFEEWVTWYVSTAASWGY